MGGYFASKNLATGPLTALSVAALEVGRAPPGRYVELADGHVDEQANITFRSNSAVYRYLPVVDHATRPVLFLRVSERTPVRDGAGRIRGILESDAIEGELAGKLRDAGVLGDHHFVLGVGRVPDPSVGLWIAGFGLLACVGALVWLRVKYLAPRG